MDPFQEPTERPEVVSREYVTLLLSRIFGCRPPGQPRPPWTATYQNMGMVVNLIAPENLSDAWFLYLEAKGILVRRGTSYGIPEQSDALREHPAYAQRSLHRTIVEHAQSGNCPRLLRHVIPAMPTGGAGSVSQSGSCMSGPAGDQATTDRDNEVDPERLRWDRRKHLEDLADFGPHAEMIFDWILSSLSLRSSRAKAAREKRQSEEERVRLFQERRAARRRQIDEAIANADVPTLARFWHGAAEKLCEPSGGPMDNDLHVLWNTSLRLAGAAEDLSTPRSGLLALRGAMTGLPGNVDHARSLIASDPKLVSARMDAAAEIAAVLVARTRKNDNRPETANAEGGKPIAGKPGHVSADRLVTAEEASVQLDTPERTIRNWIKKGDELEPVDRLGGPRKSAARYRLCDIEARKPAAK